MIPKKLLAGISFAFCILLPAVVFSDVKIVLKNGRSIVAEGCKEKGDELACSRAGGFFSIEKADIARIKGIPEGIYSSGEAAVEGPSDESIPARVQADKEAGIQKAGSSRKDLESKLAEITQRQRELRKEGAKLAKDRAQLKSALSKAPDWMTVKQFDDLSRRIADLDKRIKQFNEEVTRLNAEGKKTAAQLNGSGQPQKQTKGD